MSAFTLDPQLLADTIRIGDLPLSRVLLMNDARFPWLILVPRRAGAIEFLDLDRDDCMQLHAELRRAAVALRGQFAPHKLNVAALGNVVAQFHVHVIGRFRHDARWPQPVFGAGPALAYTAQQIQHTVSTLRAALLPLDASATTGPPRSAP